MKFTKNGSYHETTSCLLVMRRKHKPPFPTYFWYRIFITVLQYYLNVIDLSLRQYSVIPWREQPLRFTPSDDRDRATAKGASGVWPRTITLLTRLPSDRATSRWNTRNAVFLSCRLMTWQPTIYRAFFWSGIVSCTEYPCQIFPAPFYYIFFDFFFFWR